MKTKLLVTALIGTFGDDAYNVTILYGDADSKMIPVSASEIVDSSVLELAYKLSSKISLSKADVCESAYYYNCETLGSHSKATNLPSGKWILSSIVKVGIDDLKTLLKDIKNFLETPEFDGKINCLGSGSRLISKDITEAIG